MSSQIDYRPVLSQYPDVCRPHRVEFLDSAGGMSGCRLWRVEATAGTLCLRRWPAEHPSQSQLAWIHRVLRHVADAGSLTVPTPLWTSRGESFVFHEGHRWELTPWLPGTADYDARPSPAKLRAAMKALAGFHLAAATFPDRPPLPQPSPGIIARREQLAGLSAGGLTRLSAAVTPAEWPELAERGRRVLELFPRACPRVRESLDEAATRCVPLAPCIRDIKIDHVLFQGDRVTGLIDFGAMHVETVAGDVARLLGSMAGDDADLWRAGLAAYAASRSLSDDEASLVEAMDASGVLLSGIHWLEWIYQQGRQFDDRTAVIARMDAILARLEQSVASSQ